MNRWTFGLASLALGLTVSLGVALASPTSSGQDTNRPAGAIAPAAGQPAPAADPWAAPRPLTIQLSSYAFNPTVLHLKSGVVYRVHFTNIAGKSHNFSAPEFFAAAKIARQDIKKIDDGAVELDDGASTDITLEPLKAGTYRTRCTHFLHALMGMTGKVIVE